jgi:hypothetical protein
MTSPGAVVFIHGMFMHHLSWQPWVERARVCLPRAILAIPRR